MIKYLKISAAMALICFVTLAQARIVHTIFGDVEENNPLALELLDHQCMQRLKFIDQSGPEIYFNDDFPKFSRYDHSLGVYALLKMYNAPIEEQIAGLLHDVSHTVFSHLADYIYANGEHQADSYQDGIHNWFLGKIGAIDVLKRYSIGVDDVSPKNSKYTALEQPLPDMNADRIEYNLHTAKIFGDLQEHEIQAILNSLQYKDKKWFFTDPDNATKFAKLSTNYTRNFWGGSRNAAMYIVSATAIRYALQNDILRSEDLQFGMDMDVVNIMQRSSDPLMQEFMIILSNINNYFLVTKQDDYDARLAVKMRGIDPLVLQNQQLHRLTTISRDFAQEFSMTKAYANDGVRLKFKNITNPQIMALIRANFGMASISKKAA